MLIIVTGCASAPGEDRPLPHNPISADTFCADPTAVEYKGRLYVYGTNDHQQFEATDKDDENTYDKITSIVVMSTDDMINWRDEGVIDVKAIAPWITNSWAPSVISRKEKDGKTHFYMYFSNSGKGTGVLTSTDPVGPWSDPLGKPLIRIGTKGLGNCPIPFDPGAVIDDEGNGWIAFGGGRAPGCTDLYPGSARIVKLGDDLLSFDSEFAEIPAPYFFEASELNYINGTYVYTYCTDWRDRSPSDWAEAYGDMTMAGTASMVYMTTKTPLDPDSWECKGEVFYNPGRAGFDWSNNHTHMHKFHDRWYMLYHTMVLKKSLGYKGGYRSICADEIMVDEDTVTITPMGGTLNGVVRDSQICES
ncbi:MAG: family 43 glycosylhydrolase [Oscillospiraceae bacterium]|nr:family 43 glycosylhydrolase [Oscillospiraceae bacterium]